MNTHTQSLYLHSGHKVSPSNDDGGKFHWHCDTCGMNFNLHPNDEKIVTENQPVQHTATPWSLRGHNSKGRFIFGLGPGNIEIGEVYAEGPRGDANAKFIVRAVNSHEELLAAAKLAVKAYLRLPIGPDVEAIVMPEMEELEMAIVKAEQL